MRKLHKQLHINIYSISKECLTRTYILFFVLDLVLVFDVSACGVLMSNCEVNIVSFLCKPADRVWHQCPAPSLHRWDVKVRLKPTNVTLFLFRARCGVCRASGLDLRVFTRSIGGVFGVHTCTITTMLACCPRSVCNV